MKRDTWEKFGDLDHKTHGGLFIKQESETEYRVVETIPSEDFSGEEGAHYIAWGVVDLSDSWIRWADVAQTVGMTAAELKACHPKIQVVGIWHYYPKAEFGGKWERMSEAYGKTLRRFGIRIPSK